MYVSSSLAAVLLLDAISIIINAYWYQTFSAIIYHHHKLKRVASVASDVLERAKTIVVAIPYNEDRNF